MIINNGSVEIYLLCPSRQTKSMHTDWGQSACNAGNIFAGRAPQAAFLHATQNRGSMEMVPPAAVIGSSALVVAQFW